MSRKRLQRSLKRRGLLRTGHRLLENLLCAISKCDMLQTYRLYSTRYLLLFEPQKRLELWAVQGPESRLWLCHCLGLLNQLAVKLCKLRFISIYTLHCNVCTALTGSIS